MQIIEQKKRLLNKNKEKNNLTKIQVFACCACSVQKERAEKLKSTEKVKNFSARTEAVMGE